MTEDLLCSVVESPPKDSADELSESRKRRAVTILTRCNPLPVIALDLDYTIWPVNCFEHTKGPYSANNPVEGVTVSKGPVNRIYCIDARTSELRTVHFYDDVLEIVQWCREHRIMLTICSKSPSKPIVEGLLRAFGIWEWFSYPQIFNSRSKSYHFRNLSEATGLKMRDFLFYDDDMANVTMCNKLGVTCQWVDKTKGLNWNCFLHGLEVFQSKQLSRNSFSIWFSGSERLPPRQNPSAVTKEELSSGPMGSKERISREISDFTSSESGSDVSAPESTECEEVVEVVEVEGSDEDAAILPPISRIRIFSQNIVLPYLDC